MTHNDALSRGEQYYTKHRETGRETDRKRESEKEENEKAERKQIDLDGQIQKSLEHIIILLIYVYFSGLNNFEKIIQPKTVGKCFDTILRDAVWCSSREREAANDAGRIDYATTCFFDERKKRHCDVDDAVEIDVTHLTIIVETEPL